MLKALALVAGTSFGVAMVVSVDHGQGSNGSHGAMARASAGPLPRSAYIALGVRIPSNLTDASTAPAATPPPASATAPTASQTYTIDLSTVPGYSTSDVGPALQTALAQLVAPGKPGGSIFIPPVNHTIVTPVTATFVEGQRVRIFGVPGQSVLIPDTGASYDAITINHAFYGGGVGAIISFEDLVFLGAAPATYSCRRAINVDNSAYGLTRVKDVDFIGVYAQNALLRIEDGHAAIDRVQFIGADTNPANGEGLLQLWQVYDPTVRNVTEINRGTFQGVSWGSGEIYAVVEWQAPQINYNPDVPVGNLSLDGIWTESQCVYPILINSTTTYRGGRVALRNAKLTTGGITGWSPVLAYNIDSLTVENVTFNNAAAGISQYAVQLRNVGATHIRNVWGDTQYGSANLLFADSACGSLDVEESNLGTAPTMRAGIASQAATTTVRSKGVTATLATADGAIDANTLVKPSPGSAGSVAALAASDPVSMAIGVALDRAQQSGDQIRVASLGGQIIQVKSDGQGVINPGDALTVSLASGGRAARATTGSIIGRALSSAGATQDAMVSVMWSKEML